METSVFWSGNSQAIRLPKDFRVRGNSVEIFRKDDKIIILEKKALSWQDIFETPCPEFELERPDNIAPQQRKLF